MAEIKDLVIVRAGSSSFHHLWLDNPATRTFDLHVSPYEDFPWPELEGVTVWPVSTEGKFISLHALLTSWSGWRDYRYIQLADEDLVQSQAQITATFEACALRNAKLAQPALQHGSYETYPMLFRNTAFDSRRVSFMEAMAPCFRVDVLEALLETFTEGPSGSGWGLDFLWAKLLDREGLYIIDSAPMRHARPLNRASVSRNQTLDREMREIIARFDCAPVFRTFAGYAGEVELGDDDPTFLPTLIEGFQALLASRPDLRERLLADPVGFSGATTSELKAGHL